MLINHRKIIESSKNQNESFIFPLPTFLIHLSVCLFVCPLSLSLSFSLSLYIYIYIYI